MSISGGSRANDEFLDALGLDSSREITVLTGGDVGIVVQAGWGLITTWDTSGGNFRPIAISGKQRGSDSVSVVFPWTSTLVIMQGRRTGV